MNLFQRVIYQAAALALGLLMSSMGQVVQNAQAADHEKAFCGQTWQTHQSALSLSSHRLSFNNPPGPLGIGVCWWHSRFQRSAQHLMVFRPDLPRPNAWRIQQERGAAYRQWRKRFEDVFNNRRVVEIPGYSNLNQLSKDFEPLLTERFGHWQLVEGIAMAYWRKGVSGDRFADAREMGQLMMRIDRQVRQDQKVAYVRTRVPTMPLGGHSWLVIGSELNALGITLQVIDSTRPVETLEIEYLFGQSNEEFVTHNRRRLSSKAIYGLMIGAPYLEENDDFTAFRRAKSRYCAPYGGSALP